jgi:hypothetical protein
MTVGELGNFSPGGPIHGAWWVWFEGKKKSEEVFAHVQGIVAGCGDFLLR